MAQATTAKVRREEREAQASSYFHETFRPRLGAVRTLDDARRVAGEALAEDHPGRRYHERLARFLEDFSVPPASGLGERLVLMTLARRFEAGGELTTEELLAVEERFRRASPPVR